MTPFSELAWCTGSPTAKPALAAVVLALVVSAGCGDERTNGAKSEPPRPEASGLGPPASGSGQPPAPEPRPEARGPAPEAPAQPPPAEPGLPCFAPVALTGVGSSISGLVSLDLAGDRHRDLAILSSHHGEQTSEQLRTYLGDGVGGLRDGQTLAVATDEMAYALDAGDIDGDGDDDVVVQRYRGKQVALFAGAKGAIEARGAIAVPRKPTGVALARVDGDRALDLVVTSFDSIQPFLGDGKFGFRSRAAVRIGSGADGPMLADVDGDKTIDMVAVSNDESLFVVLRGDRRGGFRELQREPSCGEPNTPEPADLDGDGDVDAVYTCGDGSLELRLNDGAGRFSPRRLEVPDNTVHYVRADDFSRDGDIDLVTFDRGWEMTLLDNDGKAGFQVRGRARMPGQILSFTVTHLDRDGRPDIVGGRDSQLAIWRGAPCDDQIGGVPAP